MRKHGIAAAIVFTVCASGSSFLPLQATAAADQQAIANVPAAARQPTLKAVVNAMRKGDVQSLTRLYEATGYPIVHVWASMALERVHYHFAAATADAKLCEDSLIDQRPRIALQCGQFQSGNLQLAGHAIEAGQLEDDLIKRFEGRGVDDMLTEMRAYRDSESAVPALTIDQPNADVLLPLDSDAQVPTFSARANGHVFKLVLDTGANNLVLGEDNARSYGVKLLDRHGHVSGWLSKGLPSQRGILDELQVGAITLHHVPVVVVPKTIALLGANLIAPLGALRVSRSTLTIYGPQSNVPTCNSPMLTGTPLWGQTMDIVPQLLVNDVPHSVLLDTGDSDYLSGTRAALDEVTLLHRGKTTIQDIGGIHLSNARSAKVQITIAGQPIEMYFNILADSDMPNPITLGSGALRDMDFLLDFRHQRQCFLLHPNLH